MSLVGKFGNFEVKQTDRISQEDKAHLERWKEKYEKICSTNSSCKLSIFLIVPQSSNKTPEY